MEKDNFNRNFIMSSLGVNPGQTISQLAKVLHVSRPTIYLHLDILEKKGLIWRKKDTKKKGAPVKIFRNEMKVTKQEEKQLMDFLRNLEEEGSMDALKIMDITKSKLPHTVYLNASLRGFISKKVSITPSGRAFLIKASKNKDTS